MSSLSTKLDTLDFALAETKGLIQFRFANDRAHDYTLLDWFANGGIIKAYRGDNTKNPWFHLMLSRGELVLSLGSVHIDYKDLSENPSNWNLPYIAYVYDKGIGFQYHKSNLLRDDDTFAFSRDTAGTFEKNGLLCKEIIEGITIKQLIQTTK